ncbi:MAG: hypothetical protein Q7R84_03335 [bacterium]|nr:hypothetical protein [bacterium]
MAIQLPEMRKDKIRGRWTISAPNRSDRTASPLKVCPLCLENEIYLPQNCGGPHILYEEKDNSGLCSVRVVPNKFLLLMIEGKTDVQNISDVFDRTDAFGAHELVIDSHKHIYPIEAMSPKEVMAVWRCFIARYFDLKQDPRMKFFFMFRNYGKPAGASLEHPHSQIVVYPVIPSDVGQMISNFQHSADKYNRCPACSMIDHELREKKRLVSQNDFFAVIEPYASMVPYETWIMPKKVGVFHSPSFAHFLRDIPRTIEALAEIIIDTLERLNRVVPGLSYNMLLYTAPYGADNEQGTFHWFIMIQPVISTPGGNEKGTGIYANSVLPETAAEKLRSSK